jgi:hypothetical protein
MTCSCSTLSFAAMLAWAAGTLIAMAQELNPQQIQLIRDTAASICNTVRDTKGVKNDLQIQGDIRGQLNGLVGRVVDIGGSGKGSISREDFEGLSRDATASALEGDRGCRERVFNKMFDRFGSAAPISPPTQTTVTTKSIKQDELNAALKVAGMGRFVFGEALRVDAPGKLLKLNNEHLSGTFFAFQFRWDEGPKESYGRLGLEALIDPSSGLLRAVHISHARYNPLNLTGLLKPFLSKLAASIKTNLYFAENIDRRRVVLKHIFDEPPYVYTWEISHIFSSSNVMNADQIETTYSESVYTGACVSQCAQEGSNYSSTVPTSPIPYNPKCDDGSKRQFVCDDTESNEEIWIVARKP